MDIFSSDVLGEKPFLKDFGPESVIVDAPQSVAEGGALPDLDASQVHQRRERIRRVGDAKLLSALDLIDEIKAAIEDDVPITFDNIKSVPELQSGQKGV